MSHQITHSDAFGEVRSHGRRAWHGLGVEIPDGLAAEPAFERVGLSWPTRLEPIYCKVNGEDRAVKGSFAHLRTDNLSVLGIVSADYKPFENLDLARFADSLAGADAAVTVETAGSLLGGKRVFVLVRLPKTVVAAEGDELKTYVCLSNGHGGFAALTVQFTSVRVVCANTLAMSLSELQGRRALGASFHHTGDFEAKLAQAKLLLGLATKETERFESQVQWLAKAPMSDEGARSFMFQAWEEVFGKIDESGDPATVEELKAKRAGHVNEWMELRANERNSLPAIEGSAWATFNAITEWIDHERGHFKSVHESDARVHNNLFGQAKRRKARIFSRALAVVGAGAKK